METKTNPSDQRVGVKLVSTMVTDEFIALARRFNVTPEMLLSLAARQLVEEQPQALNVISASPLDSQDCDHCPMLKRCGSALLRARNKVVCFEKLPAGLAVIASMLALLLVPHSGHSVTTTPAMQPPPLIEQAYLPDEADKYLTPKARHKFAKPRNRRKHATKDTNPVMVAWNGIVRAGYRNAGR
jgi:hypothetical protein